MSHAHRGLQRHSLLCPLPPAPYPFGQTPGQASLISTSPPVPMTYLARQRPAPSTKDADGLAPLFQMGARRQPEPCPRPREEVLGADAAGWRKGMCDPRGHRGNVLRRPHAWHAAAIGSSMATEWKSAQPLSLGRGRPGGLWPGGPRSVLDDTELGPVSARFMYAKHTAFRI